MTNGALPQIVCRLISKCRRMQMIMMWIQNISEIVLNVFYEIYLAGFQMLPSNYNSRRLKVMKVSLQLRIGCRNADLRQKTLVLCTAFTSDLEIWRYGGEVSEMRVRYRSGLISGVGDIKHPQTHPLWLLITYLLTHTLTHLLTSLLTCSVSHLYKG